ncbi:MAG: hypothetical protein ACLTEX_13845, partial [Eggerthella lenta]
IRYHYLVASHWHDSARVPFLHARRRFIIAHLIASRMRMRASGDAAPSFLQRQPNNIATLLSTGIEGGLHG